MVVHFLSQLLMYLHRFTIIRLHRQELTVQNTPSPSHNRPPLLPAYIHSSLQRLNRHLLGLLALPGFERLLRVPPDLAQRFAQLGEERREALALVPYALFDLRFGDESGWQQAFLAAAHPRVADAPAPESPLHHLAQLVVFFAWNLAQVERRSTPLVLGMSERLAGALAAITLDRLPGLTALLHQGLTLRWAASRSYWGLLTSDACQPGSTDFRRAQLFGLQLEAAALVASLNAGARGRKGAGMPVR